MTPARYSRILALRRDASATPGQLRDALEEVLTWAAIEKLKPQDEPPPKWVAVQPKRRRA